MRKPLPLVYLALAACSGIEVTNPSCASDSTDAGHNAPGGVGGSGGTGAGTGGSGGEGGAGGEGGGAPAAVGFEPSPIEIPSCPGGTGRLRVVATNRLEEPAFVELLDVDPELELFPESFELAPGGSADLAIVSHALDSDVAGSVRVGTALLLVSAASTQLDQTVELRVPVQDEDLRKGTILCGQSWPCEGLAFEGAAGGELRQAFSVINDGCAELAIEALQAQLGDVDVVLRFEGPALPLVLAPGESWQGEAIATSGTPGVYAGKIVVASDDDEEPARELLFSVTVDEPESP